MKELKGRVAVITGAGSGIGRALALALASEGMQLALVDIGAAGLDETRGLVSAAQATSVPTSSGAAMVTTHVADVRDRARMEALAAEVQAAHGAVHLLINNAGITINKSFAQSSLEEIDRVFDINLGGVVNGCYVFLPYLKQAGEGHIVNMSSLAGFLGIPNQLAYSASKAAVRSLSETLRAELGRDGIGVTSVHPGAIKTNIMKAAVEHGSDSTQTRQIENIVMRFGMPPEALARKVVKAIKRNKMRVLIGLDSRAVELLKRLLPVALHTPFQMLFNKVGR